LEPEPTSDKLRLLEGESDPLCDWEFGKVTETDVVCELESDTASKELRLLDVDSVEEGEWERDPDGDREAEEDRVCALEGEVDVDWLFETVIAVVRELEEE